MSGGVGVKPPEGSDSVNMPFSVDFYGQRYGHLWVNNNGNVTFDGPLSTFTPFGLKATSAAIIAPFFADVDTRAAGSQTVKYGWGETTFEGHRAFCANWIDVGYYNTHADKLNSFQVLLVDRGDVHDGDFDTRPGPAPAGAWCSGSTTPRATRWTSSSSDRREDG